MALERADLSQLRWILVEKFTLSELRDLAFELGVDCELFASDLATKSEFARGLIVHMHHRDNLNCLVECVQKLRPNIRVVEELLAKVSPCQPDQKVQLILREASELTDRQKEHLLATLSEVLGLKEEQVRIVAIAGGSLRLLLSMPMTSDLASLLYRALLRNESFSLDSVTLYQDLTTIAQEAWRWVAVDRPPAQAEAGLRPTVSWRMALGVAAQREVSGAAPSQRQADRLPVAPSPMREPSPESHLGQIRFWRINAFFFVLIISLTFGLVALQLKDYGSLGFRLVFAIGWFMVVMGTFLAMLAYYAQFLTPLREPQRWFEGLKVLYATAVPNRLAPLFQIVLREEPAELPTDLAASLAILKAGSVDSHLALALEKGQAYSRTGYPGFVKLQSGEDVVQVFDLRTQRSVVKANATSSEGVPLLVEVAINFRIRQESDPFDHDVPYPVDGAAVFDLTYAQPLTENGRTIELTEQLSRLVAEVVNPLFAQYTLDELFSSDPRIVSDRDYLRNQISNGVRRETSINAIEILSAELITYDPPSPVTEQLVAEWCERQQLMIAEEIGDIELQIEQYRTRSEVLPDYEQAAALLAAVDDLKETQSGTPALKAGSRALALIEEVVASGGPETPETNDIIINMLIPLLIQTYQRAELTHGRE